MASDLNQPSADAEQTPCVSVIIPIYNVEEYLEECLVSVELQTLENIEVLLVDDGSTDTSPEIAKAFAERLDHFHYLHKENGGLGSARNYGTARARGEYVIYLDSDDIVAHDIYEKMYHAAKRDDSDMAICNVRRFNSVRAWDSGLHKRVFEELTGVAHISTDPVLINDTTAWNKLIRRSFIEKHHFEFPEGILYEDIPVTIPMHCLANQVTIIHNYGYLWRARDGASKSITQQVDSTKNMEDRLAVMRMLDKFFDTHPQDQAVVDAWKIKALETDLSIFINQFPSVDDGTAQVFVRELSKYIHESIDESYLDRVSIICDAKVRALLAGDIQRVRDLRKFQRECYWSLSTRLENGRVIADIPEELFKTDRRDVTDEINTNAYRNYIDDLRVKGSLIEIYGHIYARREPLEVGDQKVQVYLICDESGEMCELPTEQWAYPQLTSSQGTTFDKYHNVTTSYVYDGSGFKVTIDLNDDWTDQIPSGALYLYASYENPYRSGKVPLFFTSGKLRAGINKIAALAGKKHFSVIYDVFDHLGFYFASQDVFVERVQPADGALEVDLSAGASRVCLSSEDDVRTKYQFDKVSDTSFRLDCAQLPVGTELYLRAAQDDGSYDKLPMRTRDLSIIDFDSYALVARSLREYYLRFEKLGSLASVTDISREGDAVVFSLRGMGELPEAAQLCAVELRLENKFDGGHLLLMRQELEGAQADSDISLKIDFTDAAMVADLYSGSRDLHVVFIDDQGSEHRCNVYSAPYFSYTFSMDMFTAKVYRNAEGRMMLYVSDAWPEEINSWGKRQKVCIDAYNEYRKEKIRDDVIVFESMWGRQYSCNPRALYEYIDEHYPEYTCVWSLNDERTPIKGNGIRVRRGSMEYYHYLAVAKLLVNNVNFEDAYVKRDGQLEIQTMHGTPLKTLGLDVEGDFKTPEAREKYIEKNARWNYLLCQGRFVDETGDSMFGVAPEHLRLGYPRTDALISATKEDMLSMRERLGLPKDKKIIFYAPTWRKRNSFDMRLDLDAMRAALSDEYVLLVRMHHLVGDGYKVPEDGEFVFDFTSYGEIDDLYLASDIMITDYSSTMFDYALLGKPMLFFVYDLDKYAEELRGMYVDFREEAPGPLLYTSEEVVKTLQNLDEEIARSAAKYEAFREKYLGYERPNSSEEIVRAVLKPMPVRHTLARLLRKVGPSK